MEGQDPLTKFDAMIKHFKTELEKIVEVERAKMKAEVDAYNLEKERMKAVTVKDNDIIHLNVGGQKMTTKRSTLCQVEGSLLAAMFSGRWEDRLERDKDGCVFFDFNPQYFGFILDYLRAKKIETPENPAPLPKVAPDQLKNFSNLVNYLGLEEELMSKVSESFKLHSTGVTIEENGVVAVHENGNGHKYVLGENTYQEGVMRWQLKLESFKNNHWMLVGIVKGDIVPAGNSSYAWSGSYGWALGSSGQVCVNGISSIDTSLVDMCKQGDTVDLVLDCSTAQLSLALPAGKKFQQTIPSSSTWRLHVNLYGKNDKIRII